MSAETVRVAPGVTVSFRATGTDGVVRLFELAGVHTPARAGLSRIDAVWRTIAKAAIAHESMPGVEFVVLTSGTVRGGPLASVVGEDRPIRDVIDLTRARRGRTPHPLTPPRTPADWPTMSASAARRPLRLCRSSDGDGSAEVRHKRGERGRSAGAAVGRRPVLRQRHRLHDGDPATARHPRTRRHLDRGARARVDDRQPVGPRRVVAHRDASSPHSAAVG